MYYSPLEVVFQILLPAAAAYHPYILILSTLFQAGEPIVKTYHLHIEKALPSPLSELPSNEKSRESLYISVTLY